MPELPEVELCRRQLATWSSGEPLRAVHVPDPAAIRHKLSTLPSDALDDGVERLEALVGRTPAAPERAGKRLAWRFGDRGLAIHLGMTGRWVRRDASEEAPRQARVGLGFGDRVLWFLDGRRFGCVVPLSGDALSAALRDGLGPDALEARLDGPALAAALGGRRALKVALMDQQRLAGLGNIHAVEACFRARVDPSRAASSLDEAEWTALATAIVEQLEAALADVDPSEELVYVTEGGDNPFAVYGRAGEACPRCGAAVSTVTTSGRTTYWCPGCQR